MNSHIQILMLLIYHRWYVLTRYISFGWEFIHLHPLVYFLTSVPIQHIFLILGRSRGAPDLFPTCYQLPVCSHSRSRVSPGSFPVLLCSRPFPGAPGSSPHPDSYLNNSRLPLDTWPSSVATLSPIACGHVTVIPSFRQRLSCYKFHGYKHLWGTKKFSWLNMWGDFWT
jgi:hypothetical protein